MFRPTRAEINLNFLRENVRTLKKRHNGRSFFCPMIKANGYGHGDIQVAKALAKESVSAFGVVLVEEGIQVRSAGIKEKILVFGYLDEKSLMACVEHSLIPVVSSFETLDFLPKNQKTNVHLKFDTGMARLGFQEQDLEKLINYLESNKNICVEGICTHFLNGEDVTEKNGLTFEQMKKFSEIEKKLKGRFQTSHCLNSAATAAEFKGTEVYHNEKNYLGARPGIAIYGYLPKMNQSLDVQLKPVMTLKSCILQTRKIKKNETVSYGATWKASRDSLIATVCIGYADGYFRGLSNKSQMLFRDKYVPVVGRVCMDYCMVDLTEFLNERPPQTGEEITVWGYSGEKLLSLDTLAGKTDTISYEFITRLGARVPREYIED